MSIAFVFPGQGSQYVGMGKNIYENYPKAKETFEEASEVVGYDIASLCFYGPKEELDKTFKTQPCILTVSIATLRVLNSKGIEPSVVAGHSLGEYSALVAAEVINFKDAVRLTQERGKFMQEAAKDKGMMAAIIGLSKEQINNICSIVSSGYVAAANYNCPGQIVIAGEKKAVQEAISIAKDKGAKRVVPLSVSVPSHCVLMKEASKNLKNLLENVSFMTPKIPIVNNADANFLNTAESIKASLIRQLESPLLWEDSIKAIVNFGIKNFIEIGPGKVLSGLIKRIEPSAIIKNTDSGIDKILKSFL